MSKPYLITLTPTGKFFFGGDMTFAVNGKETDFTSYIIRSNKFPQQTSLLGMLRFLILRNNNYVFDNEKRTITKHAEAINLIGPKSFVNSGIRGDFGKIIDIYPCFLQKDGTSIRSLERDCKYKVSFGDTNGVTNHRDSLNVPLVEGYDSKDGISSLYLVDNVEVPESDIFVEDVCNGINRDIITGKTEDNALFKQISYRLNPKLYQYEKPDYDNKRKRKKDTDNNDIFTLCQYCFAFYAKVDLDDFASYSGQIVQVGGDNSQFVIGIKECTVPQSDECKGKKVVLLSPAYLTKEDLADVRFAITDTVPFRCMTTETKSVQSYNKRNKMYGYTKALSLYDKGSVFYFQDEDKAEIFTQKLKSHADFYQIGYNHYQVK